MSHVAGTGVGVLGGQVCRMRGAFPLHAQHRALRGPPRGFGIMRMCSSYLVSNHSYNLTCSQGETDAPLSGSRSVDTRPDSRPRPLVACSALLANGCLSTGSTEGVYTDALRCEHEKTVPRFPGAFAVLHVVVCC